MPEEALLEYFQAFGEITRVRLVSGRAEAKPFCFVRFKEKSVQDQVLNQPHCLFGRYVDAEISKTQQAELALGHWEIVAKIDQDLKTGPK